MIHLRSQFHPPSVPRCYECDVFVPPFPLLLLFIPFLNLYYNSLLFLYFKWLLSLPFGANLTRNYPSYSWSVHCMSKMIKGTRFQVWKGTKR